VFLDSIVRKKAAQRRGESQDHNVRSHEAQPGAAPRLHATPLASFERDGLKAALKKAGLPADDVGDQALLFWRFQTRDDVPVGFGGLEVHAPDALLRSLVTLPPVRRKGFGAAIVTAIEFEARLLGCHAMYLLTADTSIFAKLGYNACKRADLPKSITGSPHFRSPEQVNAIAMVKRFGVSRR
jgi:N-acetylglutamate synthase-like GNAT family acetyltransferase